MLFHVRPTRCKLNNQIINIKAWLMSWMQRESSWHPYQTEFWSCRHKPGYVVCYPWTSRPFVLLTILGYNSDITNSTCNSYFYHFVYWIYVIHSINYKFDYITFSSSRTIEKFHKLWDEPLVLLPSFMRKLTNFLINHPSTPTVESFWIIWNCFQWREQEPTPLFLFLSKNRP